MTTPSQQTPPSDKEDISALLDTVIKALHDKDAGAVVAPFDPDAVIFDLAPPLSHRVDQQGWQDWFDTWEGPVERKSQDLNFTVMGDLAVVHGLYHESAISRDGGQPAEWWMRTTVALRRDTGRWKIIHEHTSVPYYMDGSLRAATDLRP